jgi:uncharacterized protein (DUF58 family)
VVLVVSMLLGIMGASGLFGKRNLSAVEINLRFPVEIYARRPFTLAVHVRNNRSRLPLFLGRVLIGERHTLLPFVDRMNEGVAYIPFSFSSRGLQRIDAVYLESRFPFGFFIRATKLRASYEIMVFPEPLECDLENLYTSEQGTRGESSKGGLGDSSELASIREYVAGDPLKYINWKATAKSGVLKTTLYSALSRRPVLIDMNKVEIRGMEERISCVTFAIIELMKKNIPVGLRLGDRIFFPALSDSHRFSMMKELALYDHTR